jgi:3-oxoacyl-[acyl-carrier protein] reductase
MMREFDGKTVLVTGASKGIGAATARLFGEAGAHVAIAYGQDRAGAANVAGEISRAGGKAFAVHVDLASVRSIDAMVAATVGELGPVHVLVNNAGAFAYRRLADTTEEHFREIFDVNVMGLLMTTKAAVAHFDPDGGSIVNISSLSAKGNAPGRAVYAASKAAVNAITRVLALELAEHNIRVNGIMPGYVDTEGARAFGIKGSEQEARLLAATPLAHRPGEPSEIASSVMLLASRRADWITGEILTVSGGLRG